MAQLKAFAIMIVVTLVVLALVGVGTAAAHESQEIEGYQLVFGGSDEPVITSERTWLQLRITDEDGEPVTEQADTLHWRVEKPGEADSVDLEASESHGNPGVYEAAVVFTEPGEYVVHIEGTIEGTEVHTHFEKDVEDRSALDYPESEEPKEAVGLGVSPDLGIGLLVGALVAIGAFLIGRRVTSTPVRQPTTETVE